MLDRWQPRDGWRSFLGEVGIIVLGVLVALAIGAIADSIRWRLRADEMEVAIRAEMANNAPAFDERALIQSCLDARLDQLARVIREARQSGRLPDVGEVGRPPLRPMPTDAWQLAANSEAILYFETEDRLDFSRLYEGMAILDSLAAEHASWSQLRVIEGRPGPVSEALLDDLALILSRLRFETLLNGVSASQLFSATSRMKIVPNYDRVLDGGRRGMQQDVRARPICQPLQVDGKRFA